MRYHYKKPDIYLSMYGKLYICNHPVYDRCTLFTIGNKGLAVIQQRFNPDTKTTYWTEVDSWLTDSLYLHSKFKKFFDERAGECTDGLYARFFDETCKGYEKDTQYNLLMLRGQQQYANDLLHARGYVFLNDVYDMLGIDRTKEGQIVGWVYNKNNEVGDNFVDFGILETNREIEDGSYEPAILLDFNVDGNILDLI